MLSIIRKAAILFLILFSIVLRINAQQWHQFQKLTPNDRNSGDLFGFREGAIEGDYIAIGAYKKKTDSLGMNSLNDAGAIYIFKRDSAGIWSQKQKIVNLDRQTQDVFGLDLTMKNGIIAVQSWNGFDTNGTNYVSLAGSIYIFKQDANGLFYQSQKLIASDRSFQDQLGEYGAAAIEGNEIFVPAIFHDFDTTGTVSLTSAGAVFVYEKNSAGKYLLKQKITDPVRTSGDAFGVVEVKGNTMFVGAVNESYDENELNYLANTGAVFVFIKNASGKWIFDQKIVPATRHSYSKFGERIQISDSLLIVGATNENFDSLELNSLPASGAVYTFKKNSVGKWKQFQKLNNSERGAYNYFGADWFQDDSTFYISCIGCDKDSVGNSKSSAGASVGFKMNKSGHLTEKTIITPNSRYAEDYFGNGEISGNNVLYSLPYHDYPQGSSVYKKDAGAAYVFTRCPPLIYSDTFNICSGDSIYLAGAYRSEPGIYIDSFKIQPFNCDSLRYHVVETDTLDVSVYEFQGSLYSTIQTGNFQWIDCKTNLPISGQTTFVYKPLVNGSYAVNVKLGVCDKTTDCFDVNFVGLSELDEGEIRMYPNPVDDVLHVRNDHPTNRFSAYFVYDLTGKLLESKTISANTFSIDTRVYLPGIYEVRFLLDSGEEIHKTVIVSHSK